MVVDEIDGQLHTFAHELDRWTAVEAFADEYQGRPTPAMGRFSGKREWETLYHGWDLADAMKDLNFVRDDGRTLTPQPPGRAVPLGLPDAGGGGQQRLLTPPVISAAEADYERNLANTIDLMYLLANDEQHGEAIPEDIAAERGVPLTDEIKEKILGLNAARLYGIDVDAKRRELADRPVQIAAE